MIGRLAAGAVAASLALAACGSAAPHADPPPTATTTTIQGGPPPRTRTTRSGVEITGGFLLGTTIRIGAGGRLAPAQLTGWTDATLRITLRDTDTKAHAVSLVRSRRIGGVVTLAPGGRSVVVLHRLRRGTYRLLVDHVAQGQLRVTTGAAPFP